MHCGALNLIALEFCRVIDGDRDPAAVLLKVPESRLQEYVANGESAAVQNALEGYRDDIGLPVSGAGRKIPEAALRHPPYSSVNHFYPPSCFQFMGSSPCSRN